MSVVLTEAVVDTDQTTDVNSLPPPPYDPDASIDKLAQAPTLEGALIITVGAAGLRGASTTKLPTTVGLDEQTDSVLVQNALNVLFKTAILSRTLR
jgi:hypothetical protein